MIGSGRVWVFLGDSLTEGIGSRRDSYASAFARLLRERRGGGVVYVRLRKLDLSRIDHVSHYNVAGHVEGDEGMGESPLWIVNLAAESTTVESDAALLPLVRQWRPQRAFILRGPLETIVRPAALMAGPRPSWLPRGWRGYASLDPRCYFSTTPWRNAKQRAEDHAKQAVRRRMLAEGGAQLLIDERFLATYRALVEAVQSAGAAVTVLALPPVSSATFPGTEASVLTRNAALRTLAREAGASFVDFHAALVSEGEGAFFRDGFHPNERGSRILAEELIEPIETGTRAPRQVA